MIKNLAGSFMLETVTQTLKATTFVCIFCFTQFSFTYISFLLDLSTKTLRLNLSY